MRSEREAQELRNGIHLDRPFPSYWPALLARERYLKFKILPAIFDDEPTVLRDGVREFLSLVRGVGGIDHRVAGGIRDQFEQGLAACLDESARRRKNRRRGIASGRKIDN